MPEEKLEVKNKKRKRLLKRKNINVIKENTDDDSIQSLIKNDDNDFENFESLEIVSLNEVNFFFFNFYIYIIKMY